MAGGDPVAGARAGPDPAGMQSEREGCPDRAWIALDLRADPIAGALYRGNEAVRPFHGWLELVAMLEAVRRPRGSDGPTEPPEHLP